MATIGHVAEQIRLRILVSIRSPVGGRDLSRRRQRDVGDVDARVSSVLGLIELVARASLPAPEVQDASAGSVVLDELIDDVARRAAVAVPSASRELAVPQASLDGRRAVRLQKAAYGVSDAQGGRHDSFLRRLLLNADCRRLVAGCHDRSRKTRQRQHVPEDRGHLSNRRASAMQQDHSRQIQRANQQ